MKTVKVNTKEKDKDKNKEKEKNKNKKKNKKKNKNNKQKNQILFLVGNTIKQHAGLSIALLIIIIGTIVSGLLPPLVLEKMMNRLAAGQTFAFRLVISYVLLLIAAGLFDAAKESLITIFGEKVTHNLRSALCEKLSRLPAAYYTEQETGVVVSRFVNDVDTVELLFTSGIISMAVDICKVVSILGVIFVKSKGLGMLLLAVIPILFVVTRVFQKRMLTAQVANRAAVGKVNHHIPETIQNIRMIHTFQKEKFMEKRYDTFIEESYFYIEKSNFYDAIYSPIIVTTSAVLIAIMMTLSASGGQMQVLFGMSVGTAAAVIQYVGKIFDPLENIGMEIQNIQSAIAGICRIQEFLQEPERKMPKITKSSEEHACSESERAEETAISNIEVELNRANVSNRELEVNHADATGLERAEASKANNIAIELSCADDLATGFKSADASKANNIAIELQHVTFGYEKNQEILHDYEMTVREGETVTLVGRTGAGKSTIFKLLLGLYETWQGKVLIFGQEAGQIPEEKKRSIFGYVEQTFSLIHGTVRDQITLKDAAISEEDVIRAVKIAGMEETIQQLEKGYDTPCTAELFSQGQMQLLSIARAVAANPSILLLDEITANLDSVTEQKVLLALREASKNRTVLSISHRLYEKNGGRKIEI